ncbi:MAG: hypothetical protein AAF616_11435 [Bacteroidota bacterium]
MKKKIVELVKDTIPVVLGVLIALIIGNWKQQYDNQQYIDKMLATMKVEAESNLKEIQETIPKHIRLSDTIQYYMDSEVSLSEIVMKSSGIQLPTIANRTWNAVIDSRVELVDYSTLSVVTQIDESKELLLKKMDHLIDHVYQNLVSTEESDKFLLLMHVSNVIDSEQRLKKLHEEFLEEIGPTAK